MIAAASVSMSFTAPSTTAGFTYCTRRPARGSGLVHVRDVDAGAQAV
jgi:hypothetical protein